MPHRACILLLSAAIAAAVARPAPAADWEAFTVAGGSYVARLPTGWDGIGRLPLLVFFHGYRQQGSTVMTISELTSAADRHRVLLVAPDGLEGSWAHQGSPSSLRNETMFIDTLLADVERRWPIDVGRRWAGGFSQGGSMAWHAACYGGRPFAAFLPVAGAFWRPHPEACPGGPANLLHTHGTADNVVPMTGRPIGDRFRQGDVRAGITFWRTRDGCDAAPRRVVTEGGLHCEVWSGCVSRREVRLCLHDGGHVVPPGWAETALDWAEAVSSREAGRAAP